jgi:hypothetical protein
MAIYSGKTGNVTTLSSNTIVSSTDATPIVLTLTNPVTSSIDGTRGAVSGHFTNVAANGIWQLGFIDATHVSLIGSVGSGAGAGGGGKLQPYTLGATTIVDDSAIPNAGQFNVPPEFDLDVSAFLSEGVGGYKVVGSSTIVRTVDNLTTWDSITIGAASTWTPTNGPTIFTYSQNPIQPVDIIVASLDLTYSLTPSAGSPTFLHGLFASSVAPGAADNYVRMPGSARGDLSNGAAITSARHLQGYFIATVASTALKLQVEGMFFSASFPSVWILVGDYTVQFWHLRRTNMPQ